MSPVEPSEGYVENYLLLVADKNVTNFSKLLELKGIRKPDQGPLLDMFHKRIAHHDNLVDNSNILPQQVLVETPTSITTSLSTMASTAASNFNNTSSSFRANSPSTTSPIAASPTEGTRGRLNENFRKLVMTGMAFRKDLQERREQS